MEEALLTRLRESAPIIVLVGTFNDRPAIDWGERKDVLPSIRLQDVAPGRDYDFDGAISLAEPLVQIDCFAASYGAAKLLERAVIEELEQAATVGGIAFQNGFLVSGRAMEPEDLGGGIKVYRQSLDFRLWNTPA